MLNELAAASLHQHAWRQRCLAVGVVPTGPVWSRSNGPDLNGLLVVNKYATYIPAAVDVLTAQAGLRAAAIAAVLLTKRHVLCTTNRTCSCCTSFLQTALGGVGCFSSLQVSSCTVCQAVCASALSVCWVLQSCSSLTTFCQIATTLDPMSTHCRNQGPRQQRWSNMSSISILGRDLMSRKFVALAEQQWTLLPKPHYFC
jgi:hypothetical protein